MKTLGVTQYEVVDDEQGKYVLIYNGFSSCFDLFNFEKHIFSRISALTGHEKGSNVMKIKEYAKGYDRIYCSVSTDYELDYLRPVIDDRWVIGGPLIQNTNADLSDVPGEHTKLFAHEYFGLDEYDYTQYFPYFDQLMRLYPTRRALVHAYVGGTCYWNNCNFCKFDTGRRSPLFGVDLTEFLENYDKSKSHCLGHLGNPALSPPQLKTIMDYSPRKKNWLQLFIRCDKKINKILEHFDNNELKNVLVGLGIESTSETIRNEILNKNLTDENIYETMSHVVRLGGSFELSMMSNYFHVTKKCVDESIAFVKRLEDIMPPEKYRPHKINDMVITRWPVRTEKWIEGWTDFDKEFLYEKEFGWHFKVRIPEDSDVYKYNRQMEDVFNNAKFNTNDFDMFMGDPNE